MIAFILASQLLTFLTNAGLGLFVLRSNPRSDVNRLYSIYSVALAFWNISLLFIIVGAWPQLLWSRLGFSFGVVMATALFYFAVVFPDSAGRRRWLDLALGIPTAILVLFTLTRWMVSRVEVVHGYITGDLGPVLGVVTLQLIVGMFGGLGILFWKSRRARGLLRQQLLYIVIGISCFTCLFLATNLILPVFFGIFQYNNLGPIFSLPMVALIGYAIVRHRLMDIRVVIQRGLIYTVLLAFVLGFYFLVVSGLGYLFEKTMHIAFISGLLTAIAGTFGAPYIEGYFRRVTDRIFFKGRYDYSEALHELSEVLNRNLDLETLVARSSLKLKQIFRARDVTLRLYSRKRNHAGEPATEPGQASVVIPIMAEGAAIGYIDMKEKLCGDAYTAEDIKLLETFAHQAAVALEKAKLYQRVKNHSEELEEKVRERTKELQELQEEQRQMMLDISHGLQSPLTVVKGEIDILKKAAPHSKHLGAVGQSIDEISKLIYDLLHLARLDMAQVSFKEEPVNLSDLLDELVEYYEVLAQEKGVAIRKAIDPGIVIRGDRDKLKEVVTNLVSNAFKYMAPDRDKMISVGLRKADGLAELTVEDTGIGISAEDLPKIFNRFYRVKKDGEPQIEGAGLGLAICQKIVEKHGGTISVESVVGRGTKFMIRFKAAGLQPS